MNRSISTVIFFNLLSLLSMIHSCRHIAVPETLQLTKEHPEFFLKHWRIIGPFRFAPNDINPDNPSAKNGGLNHDYLQKADNLEQDIDSANIRSTLLSSNMVSQYISDDAVIPFDHIYPRTPYAVAYAYTEFVSPVAEDVAMEVGSGDGIKLWLNDRLIFETSNVLVRAAFKNTSIIYIHIQKGNNVLLAKVDHKNDAWALIASVLSLEAAHKIEMDKLDGNILSERIISNEPVLGLRRPTIIETCPLLVSVFDSRGALVESWTLPVGKESSLPINQLPRGYYELTVTTGTTTFRDSFYRGRADDIGSVLEKLKQSSGQRERSVALTIDAIMRRYLILKDPRYYKPLQEEWQKKLLLVARQSTSMTRCSANERCPLLSGFNLEEYVSDVDGQKQNYLYYRPATLHGRVPLILITPYAESPERPFLESSLIAWPEDLRSLALAADANNVAVAIANGRGTIGDAPIGETDILETLKDLNARDAIDPERIYLFGVCEGGRRALLLAEHFPTLFAAVGTYGPALTPYKSEDASKEWLEHNDVISLSGNLSNIPVVLVRGDLDEQAPPALAERLLNNIRISGGSAVSEVIHGGMHKQDGIERTIFPLLVQHSRQQLPNTVNLTTSSLRYGTAYWLKITSGKRQGDRPMSVSAAIVGNTIVLHSTGVSSLEVSSDALRSQPQSTVEVIWNGIRTTAKDQGAPVVLRMDNAESQYAPPPVVAEAFDRRFIVVLGSSGAKVVPDPRAFVSRWEQDFYGRCRVVEDKKLTPLIARNYNLVFVGTISKHTYAGDLEAMLPIVNADDHISISGRRFDGVNLEYIAVFPSPIDRHNLIVDVHASVSRWADKESNPAIGGRYRSMIWLSHKGDLSSLN